jgi:hypothetical protein
MLEYIFGAAMAVLFSCLLLWAYRRGLKDGISIKADQPVEPIKTPIKIMQENKQAEEAKAANAKITEGLANILNFNGTPQKEDDKK